jgi:hypothetical protein
VEYAIVFGAIVLAAAGLSWGITTRRRVFVIRIREGVPVLVRGKVSPAFVAEVGDVVKRFDIRRGAIYGVPKRGKVGLGFSRSIPAKCHQALRNVWTMHAR